MIAIAIVAGLAAPAAASALNVYAAASLREVFPQIDSRPTYNFVGSNELQTQIERGAPADVFASASPQEAQALFRGGRCERPVTFATNKLVMIVPKGNPKNIRSVYRLRSGGRRLAIGNRGVPIGAYTRTLLRRLGLSKVLTQQHGQPGVQRRRHRLEGRARLGRRRLRLRDRRQDRRATASTSIRLPRYAQPPVRYQICQVKRSGVDAGGARRVHRQGALQPRPRAAEGRRLRPAAARADGR